MRWERHAARSGIKPQPPSQQISVRASRLSSFLEMVKGTVEPGMLQNRRKGGVAGHLGLPMLDEGGWQDQQCCTRQVYGPLACLACKICTALRHPVSRFLYPHHQKVHESRASRDRLVRLPAPCGSVLCMHVLCADAPSRPGHGCCPPSVQSPHVHASPPLPCQGIGGV